MLQSIQAMGPTWGLTPRTGKWLSLTTIRPILSYCSTVWIRALTTDHNRKKLCKVQALALRTLSGAMPGTPNEALDYIIGIPGIINYLNGEAAKGATRLQAQNTWTKETMPSEKTKITAHSSINNEYIKNLELPKATKDMMKPKLILKRTYTTRFPSNEEAEQYKADTDSYIKNLAPETVTCYTDGSKTEDGDTGYGYITTTDNNNTVIHKQCARLPKFCSVYQAELTAITAAARELADMSGKNIVIQTDSKSAIQTLSNKLINSTTALQCHSALSAISIHNTVEVRWIQSHSGHWGNEEADILAKEGTKSETIAIGFIPQSYIKQTANHQQNSS